MDRLPDWRQRLNAFVEHGNCRSYEPGQWDCAVGTMAGVVRAVRGEEWADEYVGQYDVLEDGYALMKRLDGSASFRGFLKKRLGNRKPAAMARTGDLIEGPRGEIGLMYSGHPLFIGAELLPDGTPLNDGWVEYDRKDLKGCWHV